MDKTKIHKMWIADQGDGTYTNPILYTDYSDPDAIRVGEDYFMIASSFLPFLKREEPSARKVAVSK